MDHENLITGAARIVEVAGVAVLIFGALLAAIVAIRTLLSFTLELEVSGRWPWQREGTGSEQGAR